MNTLVTHALVSVVGAVVGGFAGGLVVWSMASPGSTPKPPKAEPERTNPTTQRAALDLTPLESRLRKLEGVVAAVQHRERSMTALKKYAESMAEEDPTTGTKKPMAGVVDGEDPVFEMAVRSVMDRVQWERDEEERVNRAQRRYERVQRQTDLISERLGLTDDQAERVAMVLTEQAERFRVLRNPDPESAQERPTTRDEWRERIRGIRQQTELDLAKVLDEEQLKSYREFADEEGFGGPFGRRGGRNRSSGQEDAPGRRQADPAPTE